jgi:DNA invertase Pin-like site-specific DNA recombinase
MAAIAELEAGLAGERTKAALAAAKQRGVRLGVTGAERAKRYKAEAVARAIDLAPRSVGTLRFVSSAAIPRSVRPCRCRSRRTGGAWHPQLVARVLQRIQAV